MSTPTHWVIEVLGKAVASAKTEKEAEETETDIRVQLMGDTWISPPYMLTDICPVYSIDF